MPPFYVNEGALELPAGWEDKTVNGFSFPAGAKKPDASFAITRDPSPGQNANLPEYVDKQLVDMAKTCPRFALVGRRDTTLGGAPAVQMGFTWRTPDGMTVQQEQTITMLRGGVALVLTATAPKDKFATYAGHFRQLVEGFRFRQ